MEKTKIEQLENKRSFLQRISGLGELGLLIVFAVIFIFFSIASDYFFSLRNITNILGQISLPAITAVGLAMLVITGEVDISIGSLQAFVALPLVTLMNATGSFILGVIAALLTGAVIGVINGLLVTRLRINSLIVTLGMYYALRGAVYLMTGKVPITDEAQVDIFFAIGNLKLFGVLPYSSILMIVILVVFIYIMRNTTYGRRLYAVGGNTEVASFIGINTKRMKFSAFVLCSTLASVSAVLLASRLGSAQHLAGLGFEFQVVAAVVLGGVSLSGGTGSLLGAFIGVAIMGIIQNGLGMLNVETMFQLVITGAIIIIAVAIDELKKRH